MSKSDFGELKSEFEQLLARHAGGISSPWREFADKGTSRYSDRRQAWGAYAHGFKLAADAVAKDVYNNARLLDVLYAPLFFLYRHYLELEIKSLCIYLEHRGWIEQREINGHNFITRWKQIEGILYNKDIIDKEDGFVIGTIKTMKLIHKIDESSTLGRYPETIKKEMHDVYLNIGDFIVSMEDIDTLFFAIYATIDQYDDYISDMSSYLSEKN